MYVTAHRVSRQETGETGINAFLYLQGFQAHLVTSAWTAMDIERVTANEPGTLASTNCPMAQGGNTVMSYLDVIAPDGTSAQAITSAFEAFALVIGTDEMPIMRISNNVAINFSLAVRLYGQEEDEYGKLCKAVLSLLDPIISQTQRES